MKQPRKMAKPFTDLVGEIENGQFLGDLTEAVHNIVAAVMDTRKPGRLTIKLAMTPTGRGTVDLKADFDAVEPEHDRPSTTFFVDDGFSLVRKDPRQIEMPLREVDIARNEPKIVEG